MAFSNNNEGSSFSTFFTSTPAAMSSFLATQTFFTTPTSADPATQLASTPTASAEASETTPSPASNTESSKTAKTSKISTAKSSSALSSSQTSAAAGVLSSNTSNASDPTNSITSPTGSTLSTSFTSAAGAASATSGSGAVVSESKSCSDVSCSPGLQAAIAVPVALVSLGLIIAFFIFARRRRRQERPDSPSSHGEQRGSRWARYLRVFSFDAELLIGGRSSTYTSSIRSHPNMSQPSMTSLRSQQPSIRSLESPAPPYGAALMSERPDSQLTAPPPYIANRASPRPPSRLSAISRPATVASNPFADPDPEDDDEPMSPVSRNSIARRSGLAYHPVGEDDLVSFGSGHARGLSDTGSIKEIDVARRASGAR